jgi:cobalt/nickel transport protein
VRTWSKTLATAVVIGILVLAIVGSVIFARFHGEGPWIDATDVVAAQSADNIGREAIDPVINTDQGNMLVLFFSLAGVSAGPVIGYYWRKLMIEQNLNSRKGPDRLFIAGVILAVIFIMVAGYEAFAPSPMIDPELGDIKLFIFISLGTTIGFFVGYHWRPFILEGGKTSVR